MEKFAVLDVETNWYDEVMSVGIVIAEEDNMNIIDKQYYLIDPEYKKPAMYSNALMINRIKNKYIGSRQIIINHIKILLMQNGVKKIFAYNAHFDKRHLPELSGFIWCDIMKIAAYRQYNKKISSDFDCCRTGRLKSGYGVVHILRMLSNDRNYQETHNAYFDAIDELEIMRLLAYNLDTYDIAIIN